jgi:hypothetical protein
MRLLEPYEIREENNDSESIYKFIHRAYDEKNLTDDDFNESKKILNNVFQLRRNIANIDANFRTLFTEGTEYKWIQGGMGAEITGIEHKGLKVTCTNIEMGINFGIKQGNTNNIKKYLDLIVLIGNGLENPIKANFKETYSYLKLDDELKEKVTNNERIIKKI